MISIIKAHHKHTPNKYIVLPEALPASCFVPSTGDKKETLKPSWAPGTDCNSSDPVGRKYWIKLIKQKHQW